MAIFVVILRLRSSRREVSHICSTLMPNFSRYIDSMRAQFFQTSGESKFIEECRLDGRSTLYLDYKLRAHEPLKKWIVEETR